MKKKILAIVMAVSMLGATVVGANSLISKVEVEKRGDYKVIVDGEMLNMKGIAPLSYEGTTYLPIRTVAEAVDKEVGWDGASKTITLNPKKEVGTTETTLYDVRRVEDLSDVTMSLTTDEAYVTDGDYALKVSSVPMGEKRSVVYNLNGQYNKMSAVVGIAPVEDKQAIYFQAINADTNEVLIEVFLSNSYFEIEQEMLFVEVDVRGVDNLKFETSSNGNFNHWASWSNVQFE